MAQCEDSCHGGSAGQWKLLTGRSEVLRLACGINSSQLRQHKGRRDFTPAARDLNEGHCNRTFLHGLLRISNGNRSREEDHHETDPPSTANAHASG